MNFILFILEICEQRIPENCLKMLIEIFLKEAADFLLCLKNLYKMRRILQVENRLNEKKFS